MIVYGTDLDHEHQGRKLFKMDNVQIEGADGSIDNNVNTEEEAIKIMKTKTGSSESAFSWHKPTKRLIEQRPSSKARSGSDGKWVTGDGMLFMYADDFVGEGTGASSAQYFGANLAIIVVLSMINFF